MDGIRLAFRAEGLLLGWLGWRFFSGGAVNGSRQFLGKGFCKDRGHASARFEFLMGEQGNAHLAAANGIAFADVFEIFTA